MGSYGGATKASIPPEGWGLLADIDNDGMADNFDFASFAGLWRTNGGELPADLDGSKSVNITDLQYFCDDWLQSSAAILVGKGDFNGDGIINIKDFAVLVGQWQQQGIDKTCDINDDAIVNIYDLYWFAKVWLR
jgi:hypothetical protein